MTNAVFLAGGTGKTGRRIVDRLRGGGVSVRQGSRGSVPTFDWSRPATWPDAVGDAEPFIDADDIADAAVATLLSDAHGGRVYDLTGPRLLTFAQAVREIGLALDREIAFARVPMDDFAAALGAAGLPADAVGLVRYLFGELFDGRNAALGSGVRDILGREPRDFRAFAEASAKEAWAWAGRTSYVDSATV